MSQPKLFSKVHCKAYLAKEHDTVRIQLFNANGTYCEEKVVRDYKSKAIAYKFDPEKCKEVEIADLSDFECDSVPKIYRKRVECDFIGFLVGYTRVDVSGMIGTDWMYDEYHDYGYCFKKITEKPKVGVVYFKNNMRRYVLPEDMEEVKQ